MLFAAVSSPLGSVSVVNFPPVTLRFPIPPEWVGELGLFSTECNSHSWGKRCDIWEFLL